MFVRLNLALAIVIIVAFALIPPRANVSDIGFALICCATFVGFLVLSFLTKMGFRKAFLWAAICSVFTLIAAGVTSVIIHGIGPCL